MNKNFTNRIRHVCKVNFNNDLHALRFEFQFQKKVSKARARTTCKKICQQFVFLERYNQIRMRNRKKFNCHWNVCFTDFAYFTYSFTKSDSFRNHFVEKFEFFEWNIQNNIKIHEKRIKSKSHKYSNNLQILRAKFQFQQKIVRTYSQSWSSEIRSKFLFFDQCSQFNIQNDEKINNHWFICFVYFAKIRYLCCNIKIDIRISNDFRNNHFIERFAFHI